MTLLIEKPGPTGQPALHNVQYQLTNSYSNDNIISVEREAMHITALDLGHQCRTEQLTYTYSYIISVKR